MERLLLVRHGQSEQHVREITGGWTDAPLTALGHRQARCTGARLAKMVPDAEVTVFSSDLGRARVTAEYIADRLDARLVVDGDLRELNNGAAAGLTTEEARAIEFPRTDPAWDWVHYPGGESWGAMAERVSACMERFARDARHTAIVVTHAGSAHAVIHWWLRLSDASRERVSFELDPGSVTELAINRWGERTIVRLNDTAHLER